VATNPATIATAAHTDALKVTFIFHPLLLLVVVGGSLRAVSAPDF
jgi:hypothetical protein